MKNKQIYLDGAANTPLDNRVLRKMLPYLRQDFVGNSHAIHEYGIKALVSITDCRAECEKLLGCGKHHEVFFTSGATESNNWVIKSLAYHERSTKGKNRKTIVCSAVEHNSVIKVCQQLETEGYRVKYVKPRSNGRIFINDVKKAITSDTFLVCVMSVNNETGVTNNINHIAKYVHQRGSLLLTDCTQALTNGGDEISIAENYLYADYLTFSAHKIYGPTGVGILVKSKSAPLYPFITGGDQEQGLRGGTHNTAGIIGVTEALKLMKKTSYAEHFANLYTEMIRQIGDFNKKYDTHISINGLPSSHKNIINLNCSSIKKSSSLASELSMYGIAVSAGSACDANASPIPSHVLISMGVPEDEIGSCIRVSFTKNSSIKDIECLFDALEKIRNQ